MIDTKFDRTLSPWDPRGSDPTPILVIGLGNPILSDDGVGWKVAEAVQNALESSPEVVAALKNVEFDYLALGGLSLMERMIGYEKVVIIDAIQTKQQPPGTIRVLHLDELPDYALGHTTAAHDTSLKTAIQVGRSMGASLPDQIIIVAIEALVLYDFSEELSPAVHESVPEAARKVIDIIEDLAQENRTKISGAINALR